MTAPNAGSARGTLLTTGAGKGADAKLRLVGSSAALVLGDLQPEQDLIAVEISGSFEAVSLVERHRAALALPGARPHRPDAPVPEVLDDQVERAVPKPRRW